MSVLGFEPPLSEEEQKESDRFADTFFVLWHSYEKGRGRTLDPEQVKVLVEAFGEISQSQKEAMVLVEQLEKQVAVLTRKRRLWRKKQ